MKRGGPTLPTRVYYPCHQVEDGGRHTRVGQATRRAEKVPAQDATHSQHFPSIFPATRPARQGLGRALWWVLAWRLLAGH